MPDEKILDLFEARELETLLISLNANSSKLAVSLEEFIQLRLSQGADLESIRTTLLRDLENNGRIFGEFKNSIKSTARGSINRVRDAGLYSQRGVGKFKYRWVAILVRTCEDCLSNHGRVATWDEWEASEFGLPRSGGTRCRQNCHCVLVDANASELEPMVIEKRSERLKKARELNKLQGR